MCYVNCVGNIFLLFLYMKNESFIVTYKNLQLIIYIYQKKGFVPLLLPITSKIYSHFFFWLWIMDAEWIVADAGPCRTRIGDTGGRHYSA